MDSGGEPGGLQPWGHKESELTGWLSAHTHTSYIYENNYTNIILLKYKTLYIYYF